MPLIDMPLEELYQYTGRNPRPNDFDAYWSKALDEMRSVDAQVELIRSDFQVPYAECFDLWFTGVGGARVYARYIRPKLGEAPYPAVVAFHGYTMSSGCWSDHLKWAAAGFAVAAMDCRGQGGRSQDVASVDGTTLHGHIIRGLEDNPEKLLYRQIFLDTAQLANIVMDMDDVNEARVGATGGSQGGALTLACAALEPRIKRATPVYPFLCDYLRVWEMDLDKGAYDGLRQFLRRHDPTHARKDEWFHKLGYIDIQHLAPRIQGEVLMACGLVDVTCPPSTQFAAYNKITAPKEVVIYPDFGHENLPGFEDRVVSFMLGM